MSILLVFQSSCANSWFDIISHLTTPPEVLEHVYMGPEVNSNWLEISLRDKISLRYEVTSLSAFT